MNNMAILNKIRETDKIAVVTHASPDGDAVGSTLAITLALRSLGKDVVVLSKEPAPENLSYLTLLTNMAKQGNYRKIGTF